jgi:hypothetical protein
MDTRKDILSVLDRCCGSFTFPMLDNGYIYPAATRLSLYRSNIDWAIVIEVFGFSPRAGLPDTTVYTFGSRLHNRDTPEQYLTREAYDNYLRNNPNNESQSVFPIDEGPWQDPDDSEVLADNVTEISLRQHSRLRDGGRDAVYLGTSSGIQSWIGHSLGVYTAWALL